MALAVKGPRRQWVDMPVRGEWKAWDTERSRREDNRHHGR